ncbi:OmpA family protein [uncultured Umboniibacter sp.]|uniref:OmpA family protein n=1 Tax=uncultured Umboniibacter sp. TaxID=1798917 RepID=UPI002618A8C9|nr:OmpA family protein [uncultured Umboniibacter sp.]
MTLSIIKTTALTTVFSIAAVTSPATLAETNHALDAKQGATFLGGAVVGAAAGGPVGFVIGGILGAYYAEELGEADQVEHIALEMQDLNQALTLKTAEVRAIEDQLAEQQQLQQQSLVALERALNVETLFGTDQYELFEGDKRRLQQVAQALNEFPEVLIEIHGFADHRGDATYNAELSQKRADAVASALVEAGIEAERLMIVAGGEVVTAELDSDLSRHRRATINIELQATAIAQN